MRKEHQKPPFDVEAVTAAGGRGHAEADSHRRGDAAGGWSMWPALETTDPLIKAVFSSLQCGLFIIDGESRRIMAVNRYASLVLGYLEGDLIGRSCRDLFCTYDADRCPAMQGIEVPLRNLESEYRTSSGQRVPVLFSIQLMRIGEKVYFVNSFVEITGLKEKEQHLRRQRRYLQALHETTLAVVEHLDLEDLLGEIMRRACALAETEHGFIYLRSRDGTAMRMLHAVGSVEVLRGRVIRKGEGLCGQVWQQGAVVRVEDYRHWPGRLPDSVTAPFRAALGVPVFDEGRVIGVLGLVHIQEERSFADGTVSIIENLAQLAGVALVNARLFGAAQASRQRAEQTAAELAATNEELRKLQRAVEHSPASIVITDPDGTIEYVNPKFCQISGYRAEEALGQNPRILKSGHQSSEVYRDLWQTISAGRIWSGELCNRRRDGSLFWEHAHIGPIRNAEGGIEHFIALKEDITKRREIEEKLRASENRYRRLYENAPNANFSLRPEDGVILRINAAAGVLLGLEGNRLLGRPLSRFFADTPQTTDKARSALSLCCRGAAIRDLEVQMVCSDGTLVWTSLYLEPVRDREGKVTEIYAMIIDTSERKALEASLIQSDKLSAIGQLAAGVAHEINNPTGFVLSNLKTLADYAADIGTLLAAYRGLAGRIDAGDAADALAQHRKQVAGIEGDLDVAFLLQDLGDLVAESREGMERIRKIVADLKHFAHPGEDAMVPTDLNGGLESTLNVVWNELKYKAEVTRDFAVLPPVLCHPQQINQVFMNILVNAAHAIEARGWIHIATRTDGHRVEVVISDSGAGIAPAHLGRIFDPFFTTKPVGKGTGLGLNIAFNIVTRHGGTIEAASTPGQGTAFTIRLPAMDAVAGEEKTREVSEIAHGVAGGGDAIAG